MVPAPGRQRQSQQIVPKKPSFSLLEILRRWLLRDKQEQIPISPLPHPHWGCGCSAFGDSSAWCQQNAAPLCAEHLSLLCRSPACAQPVIPVLGCSLEPRICQSWLCPAGPHAQQPSVPRGPRQNL